MRNAANEAKRMWLETYHLKGKVDDVAMDSKADDGDLLREFKRQRRMNRFTYCRSIMDKTQARRKMIKFMRKPKHNKLYLERSFKVEPMQGLAMNKHTTYLPFADRIFQRTPVSSGGCPMILLVAVTDLCS